MDLKGAKKALRRSLNATKSMLIPSTPLLSIVVPVYNVGDYLADTLESLLAQTLTDIEVIIIDDGSTDGSAAIAREYARGYKNVKYFRQENQGLSAARNAGFEKARGTYLAFLDSDDLVYPRTYQIMVDTLEKTGSDFVVCGYNRYSKGQTLPAGKWIRDAHSHNRLKLTIREYPEILVSQVAWNKVYRASFFRDTNLQFPHGVLYEDQLVSTKAYLSAKRFDVLSNQLIRWRIRDSGDSITQNSKDLQNLSGQMQAWRSTISLLQESGSSDLAELRSAMLVGNDIPRLLLESVGSDELYRNQLADLTKEFLAAYGEKLLAGVRVQSRVALRYLMERDYESLDEYLKSTKMTIWDFPVRATKGEEPLIQTNVLLDNLQLPLQSETDTLAPSQVAPVTEVRSFHFDQNDEVLHLRGWSYYTNHDASIYPVSVDLVLVRDDGVTLKYRARKRTDHEANLKSGSQFCDYSNAGWKAEIPFGTIERGAWSFFVEISQCDHSDRRVIKKFRSAEVVSCITSIAGATSKYHFSRDSEGCLSVSVENPSRYRSRIQSIEGSPHVVLDGAQVEEVEFLELRDPVQDNTYKLPVIEYQGSFVAPIPSDSKSFIQKCIKDIEVRAVKNGVRFPIGYLDGTESLVDEETNLLAARSKRGNLKLTKLRRSVFIDNLTINSTDLSFDALAAVEGQEGIILSMMHKGIKIKSVEISTTKRTRVSLSFERVLWRDRSEYLPVGTYEISFEAISTGEFFPVVLSAPEQSKYPILLEDDNVRYWLTYRSSKIQLHSETPISTQIRNPFAQKLLKEKYRSSSPVMDEETVVFRTYYGESATCNALAISEYILRNSSDFKCLWITKDHTVPIPNGSYRVIYNSEQWYEVIASSKFYIDNVHQPDYVVKKPGQVFVQTMHGYPFKNMGLEYWISEGYSKFRITSFLKRASDWDYFISPSNYATPLLRDAFGFHGEFLEIGYPRNDVFFEEQNLQSIRLKTRRSLNIRPDQHVILYGPTWRDYLSVSEFKSEIVDFVDLDKLSQELGDNYVFLLRGHQMNARMDSRGSISRNLIDVTNYYEIRDLICASDSAVLDYSSLRFDYALTGKPMIYLVPDLEEYKDSRGWLFDYEPTTAGPFVETHEELHSKISSIDEWQAEYSHSRKKMIDSFMELEDGHSSSRFARTVFDNFVE